MEHNFVTGHLKFAMYDSGIASTVGLLNSMDPVQDLGTFLDRSRGQAKLIYGDINAGDELLKKYRVRINVDETDAIRGLDRGDVLIVTNS